MIDWRPGGRRRGRRARRLRWMMMASGSALLIFGIVKLIQYGLAWNGARRTSEELRAAYQAAPTEAVTQLPSEEPLPTIAPEPTASQAPEPTVSALGQPADPTPVPRLPKGSYPYNPTLKVDSRFRFLRAESKDIAGWLTVDSLLDEAVVQRDNVYYLTHDALGNENVNGALFLDAAIDLKTRPYTLIVYGHNMKTGAMFGSLRNYENIAFYHTAPFITFDTVYEGGRYVIFAVGSVSTEESSPYYVDFYSLRSDRIIEREAAIKALISASSYTCPIDVRTDDQLLLLVTCVEKQ